MSQQSLYLESVFCLLFCLSSPTSTKIGYRSGGRGPHSLPLPLNRREGAGLTKNANPTNLSALHFSGGGGEDVSGELHSGGWGGGVERGTPSCRDLQPQLSSQSEPWNWHM